MRIVALDVGSKRIGIAVSDPTGLVAGALTVLERRGTGKDTAAVADLLAREAGERIVVGLPLTLRGETGPQAQEVLQFVAALKRRVSVPVETWDERYTTVEADRILEAQGVRRDARKQRIDAVAAAVLLQEYLDAHSRQPGPSG